MRSGCKIVLCNLNSSILSFARNPFIQRRCNARFAGGQTLGSGGAAIAKGFGYFEEGMKIHAHDGGIDHAELTRGFKDNVPNLPAFDGLRFMLEVRAKIAAGIGFAFRARQIGRSASIAIGRPAAKVPAATGR